MQIKEIKEQVAIKVKNYTKPILIFLISLVALYGAIYLFTKKEHAPVELQAAIDSLTKANAILIQRQKQLDSTIKAYDERVSRIDGQISGVKQRTTIIKEYYHDQIQAVGLYNLTQVDSFFKQRYNY